MPHPTIYIVLKLIAIVNNGASLAFCCTPFVYMYSTTPTYMYPTTTTTPTYMYPTTTTTPTIMYPTTTTPAYMYPFCPRLVQCQFVFLFFSPICELNKSESSFKSYKVRENNIEYLSSDGTLEKKLLSN